VDQRIKFCCKSSRNTTKGLNWIRDHLDYKIGNLGNISLYVWLGTCDLTSYNKGYISLHTDSNNAVDQATQNFNEIVTIFKEYPGCKLTFIETPPYSIYEWNKYFKRSEPNQFKNEDNILIRQVLKLNANIKEINSTLGTHSPTLANDLSHKQKNTKNRHHRLRDNYNFTLYKDGVHPAQHLARVWLRKIGQQMTVDCFQ